MCHISDPQCSGVAVYRDLQLHDRSWQHTCGALVGTFSGLATSGERASRSPVTSLRLISDAPPACLSLDCGSFQAICPGPAIRNLVAPARRRLSVLSFDVTSLERSQDSMPCPYFRKYIRLPALPNLSPEHMYIVEIYRCLGMESFPSQAPDTGSDSGTIAITTTTIRYISDNLWSMPTLCITSQFRYAALSCRSTPCQWSPSLAKLTCFSSTISYKARAHPQHALPDRKHCLRVFA